MEQSFARDIRMAGGDYQFGKNAKKKFSIFICGKFHHKHLNPLLKLTDSRPG